MTGLETLLLRTRIKKNIALCCILVLCIMLTGCAEDKRTKVFLTTGFSEDELFVMEDTACLLPELMIYLKDIQSRYESVYGEGIWSTTVDGVSMADNIKDNALSQISQIKAMTLFAKSNNIELTEDEITLSGEAAKDFYESLSPEVIEETGITVEILENMYKEYALANKLYAALIEDINPEISDDEARTITVQHIFIKTYTTDNEGKMQDYSDSAKEIALRKAEEILKLALDGEHDFHSLVLQYSDGNLDDYSFGKNATEPEFEEAAFNLGVDEISGIVTTKYGYHIIKCLSTFNREETDLNKIVLADVYKQKNFGEHYDNFASNLTTYFNDELWQNTDFKPGIIIDGQSFFTVYNKYFK